MKKRALAVMVGVQLKADARIKSVTPEPNQSDHFVVTRDDGNDSTFTVRVTVTGKIDNRAHAEVEVVQAGQVAEIRISSHVKLNTIDRVVANAVAQASEILQNGARVTDNALDRDTHPGDHPTPSVADRGREAEVRHLDRAVRRRRMAHEMKTLIENLGMHADDPVAKQRKAVSSVETIVSAYAKEGTPRPAWAKPPNGYPGWKAFYLIQLPTEMATGWAAGWAMLQTGAPPVMTYAVWTTTTVTAIGGTIAKQWIGLRDKTRVDKGHGLNNQKRAHARAVRRRSDLDRLFQRLHVTGLRSKPPREPDAPDGGEKTNHGKKKRFYFRGLPPLIGAASTTPFAMLGGLPWWTYAAHWGVAIGAAAFGTMHEKYLRKRLVPQEWARLDNEGRKHEITVAKFDEKALAQLHNLLDRVDRVRGTASAAVTPVTKAEKPNDVKWSLPTWYGVNQVGGQSGDVARAGTGWAEKHMNPPDPNAPPAPPPDAPDGVVGWLDKHFNPIGADHQVSANPIDILYTGLARAGAGIVIGSLMDWGFVSREYRKIVDQVKFDFGNRIAEHVDLQEEFMNDVLDGFENLIRDAEVAHGGPPDTDRTPVPSPEQRDVVTNPKKRPAGRQGIVAFAVQSSMQAGSLYGAMWGATEWFNQNPTGIVVISAVGTALAVTFLPKYALRRNEQNKVNETIFRDRDRERPIEEATAEALKEIAFEIMKREIDAAVTGNTTRKPTPTVTQPTDPTDATQIKKFVKEETELLRHEPRAIALIGHRALALKRMTRLVERVRIFEAHAIETGNTEPLKQARTDMAELYKAYKTMTDENDKDYGKPLPDDEETLLKDAAERRANRKPPGFRGGEPGTRPAGDLQSYFNQSVDTPAGRAYYAPGDDNLDDAADLQPDPGWYTIDMHGHADSVRIGEDRLTVEDLAQLIEMDGKWSGQPIRLLACETGKQDNGFAKQLADRLGVRVKAPVDHAGVGPDGQAIVTTSEVGPDGSVRAVIPPTSRMRVFEPAVPREARPDAEPAPESPGQAPAPAPPTAALPGLAWPHYEEVRIGEMREMELIPEVGELALLRSGPTVYTGAERLWPDELANIVAESGDWTDGPIRIQIREGSVDPEFVQRFADMLGVPVLINASAVTGDFATLSSGTLEVYNEPSPVEKPAGAWRVYEPRNVTAGRE
ncbi:hypothetical protein [Actinophytocola sp.]|uniref:hypothetical protein n=1 Tax=Actinophytocola sp. TaxID=1872138 RepID=UPI002ED082D9